MKPYCLIAALLLVGCADSGISRAKELVTANLVDPKSAEFRNVTAYKSKAVCGEVNAKNSFGGYVGFTRFVMTKTGNLEIEPKAGLAKSELDGDYFKIVWQEECRD